MERCPVCSYDAGSPNRREVDTPEERSALASRYNESMQAAEKRGARGRVEAFEAEVRDRSKAVINLWPSLLADFLNDGRPLYSNYTLQLRAEIRRPATPKHDRERWGTEGLLFGAFAHEIRYGALSLNANGLISYGSCSVTIADLTTSARATVLEENSYTFVRRHVLLPGNDIPEGHRALWGDRHKLAVAKLADRIHRGTADTLFPRILLYSDGDRARDEFMEVHFYGLFDRQSVEVVSGPKPETAALEERPDLERIRDWVQREGKTWLER